MINNNIISYISILMFAAKIKNVRDTEFSKL